MQSNRYRVSSWSLRSKQTAECQTAVPAQVCWPSLVGILSCWPTSADISISQPLAVNRPDSFLLDDDSLLTRLTDTYKVNFIRSVFFPPPPLCRGVKNSYLSNTPSRCCCCCCHGFTASLYYRGYCLLRTLTVSWQGMSSCSWSQRTQDLAAAWGFRQLSPHFFQFVLLSPACSRIRLWHTFVFCWCFFNTVSLLGSKWLSRSIQGLAVNTCWWIPTASFYE